MNIKRRCAFVAGVIGIVAFCVCSPFLKAYWVGTRALVGVWQQREPMSVETLSLGKPMLGIVLPLIAEEMAHTLESLQHWPTKCSTITSNRVDIIFYFAEKLPVGLDRQLRDARVSTSCFKTTKVVSALLHLRENVDQDVRSAQFYKLFLAPDIRAHFVEYDALAILDWDIIIAHKESFERLYSIAFTATKPFWIKGSRHVEPFSDDEAPQGMWHSLDHLDGNAIYNNSDIDFFYFVNLTLERWQFTRPYDVALWATITDFPYSWPLWQQYASKFVEIPMVSTAGIQNLEDEPVTDENAPDALFLRRAAGSIEKHLRTAKQHFRECNRACRYSGTLVQEDIISKVRDTTCMGSYSWIAFRFGGYNCGAGDHLKYGTSCRLCFTDQHAALNAEQALAGLNRNASTSDNHVITYRTKRPPEATDCSRDCKDNTGTVSNETSFVTERNQFYPIYRPFAKTFVLFLLQDTYINAEARRADKVAREAGGRVIMCETYEVPPGEQTTTINHGIGTIIQNAIELGAVGSTNKDGAYLKEPSNMNPAAIPFIGDITRENICLFIPGYFEFFHEARIAISTISTFMPGVRVEYLDSIELVERPRGSYEMGIVIGAFSGTITRGIGDLKWNFSELNAAVSVVNTTRVAFASLAADKACGNQTRLIYYMDPGEVLSRPFTARDTFSRKGELLVRHTDANLAGGEFARRSMEINVQLRAILRVAMAKSGFNGNLEHAEENFGTNAFNEFLDSISSNHSETASIYIPELLAALLFLKQPVGVQLFDPGDWRLHSYTERTIMDVSFVKPRFGCSIDLSLSLQGYDVAHQLEQHVQAFYNEARCDQGFVDVNPATLKLKDEWEFPASHPISDMPSLKDYRISLMYRTFSGDTELFDISFRTAIKHIPDALEMVVVVEEMDKYLFEQLLAPHRESAPFPLRVVTEPSIMDGHVQQKYSKMRADLYTKGDYILHLDSDVLILQEVTYEHIFHLGKPVLPFRRYRDDTPEGLELTNCWQNGTSFAIGEEVVHEFSIFNTHVYPRQMYSALRQFVVKKHRKTFSNFMSTRVGKCSSPEDLARWTADKRSRLLSDFNLMGAYLWYHMPEAVYWMAADPYDLRPDQWRIDLIKYQWVCQSNGRSLPKDVAGKAQFKADLLSVENIEQCNSVVQHWMKDEMKKPETRTPILRIG